LGLEFFNANIFSLTISQVGLLDGPSLPLLPPPIGAGAFTEVRLSLDYNGSTREDPYVLVVGSLNSLIRIPEPTCLALLVMGDAAILSLGRGRKS
jgi:hypothetical protein